MAGTYAGYGAGIVFSTGVRWGVAKSEILSGDVAFFAVLYATALFNFLVLRHINRDGKHKRT
jgi:hypothetical protein